MEDIHRNGTLRVEELEREKTFLEEKVASLLKDRLELQKNWNSEMKKDKLENDDHVETLQYMEGEAIFLMNEIPYRNKV